MSLLQFVAIRLWIFMRSLEVLSSKVAQNMRVAFENT